MRVVCENSDQPGQPWHYLADSIPALPIRTAARAIGQLTNSAKECIAVTVHFDDGTSTKVTAYV